MKQLSPPVCVIIIGIVMFCLGDWAGYSRSEKQFNRANLQDGDKAGASPDHCDDFNHYMRDYQIELHMDTVWVYDNDRLVDSFLTNYSSKYDSIFINDNL